MWTSPEQSAVPYPSPELAVSESLSKPEVSQSSPEPALAEASPEVALSEPSPPAKFRFDTGVFQMEPTALAPGAKGYLAAIIPQGSTDKTTAMVALSLTGLPTKSVFHVRTKDVGRSNLSLGSGRTDINGSAVAVMLRSSPTTAAVGAPTLSVASTEPPVTLNFDGATGEDLEVVDTAGNVCAMRRSYQYLRSYVSEPFSNAMRLHAQAFRQLKSQRISKQPGRNKLMNQQFQ